MSKELEVHVYITLSTTCLLQNYAFTLRSHKLLQNSMQSFYWIRGYWVDPLYLKIVKLWCSNSIDYIIKLTIAFQTKWARTVWITCIVSLRDATIFNVLGWSSATYSCNGVNCCRHTKPAICVQHRDCGNVIIAGSTRSIDYLVQVHICLLYYTQTCVCLWRSLQSDAILVSSILLHNVAPIWREP